MYRSTFLDQHGRMDLVKKYVEEYGAYVLAKECLSVSLENKHYHISNFLMKQGAKLENDQDLFVLYNFCKEGLIDLTKLGANFVDLLCHCSLKGDLDLCQQLIEINPGVELNGKNRQNKTALNEAAIEEQYDILEYLLNKGATWEDINKPIKDNLTPLYFICKGGLIDWVKKFVEIRGADVQATECLAVSALEEQYDVLEYLLSQGATWEDINKPIKDKFTPLYFVCRSGLIDLVTKYVQEYKADINGEGCLQVAIEYYHSQVADYLINSGCNVNQVKDFNNSTQFIVFKTFNF